MRRDTPIPWDLFECICIARFLVVESDQPELYSISLQELNRSLATSLEQKAVLNSTPNLTPSPNSRENMVLELDEVLASVMASWQAASEDRQVHI